MKTKNLLLPALISVLNLLPAGRVTAQTFTALYSFTGLTLSCCSTDDFSGEVVCNCSSNSDGAFPDAGLTTNSSGNTLYGTAAYGGSSGNGTVFAVNADGTGFTNLHSFTGYSDGANPFAGLILSGNTLYGTTFQGGSLDVG